MVSLGGDDTMKRVPYERDGLPRPVIGVTLLDPMQRSSTELVARIDTGFEGGLLITLDQYLELKLQEFEEPTSSLVARSALGIGVTLRSSRGIADIGGVVSECSVYTTPLLLKPLLGRELLNRWTVTLDGPKGELAI
jgi:predicted aspartyl protease